MLRLLTVFFLFQSFFSLAQSDLTGIFGPPLRIPLYLSGNFAELRNNHFHTGLDIKTAGVEGQDVIAAASGRVSRIAISPAGYGNAIYIEHPNGYTTVYAHLQSFAPKIAEFVLLKQYEDQSFKIDVNVEQDIRVEKGELIGLSGNSGSSAGAHLHFEIRDTKSERAQNPLHFGFDIKDNIAPRLRGIRFHPLSDTTQINGQFDTQSFVVTGEAGNYQLKAGQKIEIYGAFGVSLHGIDQLNGQANSCGLYSLNLKVDEKEICAQQFDELDFATNRHINCYMDYEAFKTKHWHYHKSFVEQGNKLEIYRPRPVDRGVIHFKESGNHKLVYEISDAHGNKSLLKLSFSTLALPKVVKPTEQSYTAYFWYNQNNSFSFPDELTIEIPSGALYDNLKFQASRQMGKIGSLSPRFLVHNYFVPLQTAIKLQFAWFNIPPELRSKIVAKRSDPLGKTSYINGIAHPNYFEINTKDFGEYSLVVDTIPPVISPSKYNPATTLTSNTNLRYTIRDGISGISTYKTSVNGTWNLAEYDAKNNALTIVVSKSKFVKGDNTLEIEVTDNCGNRTTKTIKYRY